MHKKKIEVCNSSESNDIKERPKSLAVSETVPNYINQTMYGSMPLSDVKKSNNAKPTSVSLKDQRKQRSLQLCLQVSAQIKKSSKTYQLIKDLNEKWKPKLRTIRDKHR